MLACHVTAYLLHVECSYKSHCDEHRSVFSRKKEDHNTPLFHGVIRNKNGIFLSRASDLLEANIPHDSRKVCFVTGTVYSSYELYTHNACFCSTQLAPHNEYFRGLVPTNLDLGEMDIRKYTLSI